VSNGLMIVLRLIHILTGVFWAGAAMAIAWFLLPAQRTLGQPGMRFMQEAMMNKRLRSFLMAAMGLAILSGLTMYILLTVSSNGEFARSGTGRVLGIGALAGIIAGAIGGGYVGKRGKQLAALGTAVQASGGMPTDAQKAEMASLESSMFSAFRIVAILLVIAVAAMASARYM
jgi:hypothetical protein